jgi:hypothetical protein
MLDYSYKYGVNMLGAWGFLLAALCFGIFALTFQTMVVDKTKLKLSSFSYAYYFMAVALAVWSVAAANGDSHFLKTAVLIGDGLLLAGSVFMLYVLIGDKNRTFVWLSVVLAAVLLFVRAKYYSPAPFMSGGILEFNSQTPVALALGAIFAAVWLPANISTAKQVAHAIRHDEISSYYIYIYTAATISALLFLAAKRVLAVVLSFAAIGVCFLMLIASNMLVSKLGVKNGTK